MLYYSFGSYGEMHIISLDGMADVSTVRVLALVAASSILKMFLPVISTITMVLHLEFHDQDLIDKPDSD